MDPEVIVAIITGVVAISTTLITALSLRANASQKKVLTQTQAGLNEAGAIASTGLAVFNMYKSAQDEKSDGGKTITPAEMAKIIAAGQSMATDIVKATQKVIDSGN
jgi:hypothetical protein